MADLNGRVGWSGVSKETKQLQIEQGMSSDKRQVIYKGVETDMFCQAAAAGTLKRQLGLCDNAVLLANIGQICLRKGQTLLARAAVELAEVRC